MGAWIELGIFGLVLAFGVWQWRDLRRERRRRESQAARTAGASAGASAASPSDTGRAAERVTVPSPMAARDERAP